MRYPKSLLLLLAAALLAGCATIPDSQKEAEFTAEDIEWPAGMNAQPRDLTPVQVEPETVLIEGATIMTATGETIEGGSLLLKDGEIVQVSKEAIEAPDGAKVVDGDGKFVTPGLIDTHSHLGGIRRRISRRTPMETRRPRRRARPGQAASAAGARSWYGGAHRSDER